MKKSTFIKRFVALFLVVLMSINTFAAVVGDNDGAAFITKAEFDSMKNEFQSQLDRYNSSIDNKIDGAIASYLAGLSLSREMDLQPATENYADAIWSDTFLVRYHERIWYDSANDRQKKSTELVDGALIWGCPPKERFHTTNSSLMQFNINGNQVLSSDEYYGHVWNAYVTYHNDYTSNYFLAPFTTNNNGYPGISRPAPHFAIMELDPVTNDWAVTDVVREYALTTMQLWGQSLSTEAVNGFRSAVIVDAVLSSNEATNTSTLTVTDSNGNSWNFNYNNNAVQLPIVRNTTWNRKAIGASSDAQVLKTSWHSAGINNSNIHDYTWVSIPENTTSITNYLNYGLYGNLRNDDTLNVLYKAENGIYDWSKASSYTTVHAQLARYNDWPISLNRDPVSLTFTDHQFQLRIPNFYEHPLRDLPTKLKYKNGYLKAGQGMPLCLDIPYTGILTIDFTARAYNNTTIGACGFTISHNDFLSTYDPVTGTVGDSVTPIELNNVALSSNNTIQIPVNMGDNLWLKIRTNNSAGSAITTNNNRIVKVPAISLKLLVN